MGIRVRLEGTDRVFPADPGVDLLEVCQSNAEPISTSCGGVASCGLCRVTVVSGREHLVPIKPQEIVHLGNVAKVLGLRLACQACVVADVAEGAEIVIRIPPVDDVEARKRKKAERARVEVRASRGRPPASTRPPPIEWRPGRRLDPENGPEGKGGS
jgi:2Fe-2S ferredoxin